MAINNYITHRVIVETFRKYGYSFSHFVRINQNEIENDRPNTTIVWFILSFFKCGILWFFIMGLVLCAYIFFRVINEFPGLVKPFKFTCIIIIKFRIISVFITILNKIITFTSRILPTISIYWNRVVKNALNSFFVACVSDCYVVIFRVLIKYFNIRW